MIFIKCTFINCSDYKCQITDVNVRAIGLSYVWEIFIYLCKLYAKYLEIINPCISFVV